jgi:hypothetical protein
MKSGLLQELLRLPVVLEDNESLGLLHLFGRFQMKRDFVG